jgi:hypothetical protein
MSTPNDLIPLKEARQILGVSDRKMTFLITKDKLLKTYTNPLDKRQRLVSRAEVESLKQPRESKAA